MKADSILTHHNGPFVLSYRDPETGELIECEVKPLPPEQRRQPKVTRTPKFDLAVQS